MSDASKAVYNWQSSANVRNCIPCLLIMSSKCNMLIMNRTGPSTDPWGTPRTSDVGFDWVPLIRTDCDLTDHDDLNHFKADPQIPGSDLSLCGCTSWSTVSKAALKSSLISNALCCHQWPSKCHHIHMSVLFHYCEFFCMKIVISHPNHC